VKKLHIQFVKSGHITAKSILLENGNILLGAGVTLTDRYIQRLKSMGIDTMFIEDPMTDDIIPDDVIRDETRRDAVRHVHKTMTELMDHPLTQKRTALPKLGSTFRDVFGSILQDIQGRGNVLISLANLHTQDGYLFHHSVNVAVLAGILGISKGYNRDQLMELGIGALLFDIGMTKIPVEVINKTTPITPEERELLQTHTKEGFDILRSQHDISLLSAHCALQHHERFDGTGYPRQLKQKEIHEYAQIVAIADVYDALTSARSYRVGFTPGEASEFLFASGNQYFNIDLVKHFLKHISIYPVSTTVQLNTGQIGVVAAVDPDANNRPIVRITTEADGTPCKSPYEIDLQKHYNILIMKTL